MDRDDALDLLPSGYATALRLRDAGSTAAEIAEHLALDDVVVATLLEIADRKLRRLLSTG